ncbi:hypothetical protein BC629DRAFT_1474806 [Irpex lacteus]|nr:hypothetical protein BC629DRAFT_1474806 [Irpex lacteus]
MRGLPRRAAASAAPLPTPSSAATPDAGAQPVPKFSGFAGFGSSTANSTPFSFGAPAKPSSTTTPSFTAPSSTAFSSTTSPFTPSSTTQAASNSTSNATKLFTSIVNSSSEPTAPKPSGTKSQNGHVPQSAEDDRVNAETAYYTALRGLNVAFLAACQKAVDADPYTDIASVLERYSQLRSGIKSDYDESLKKSSSSTATTKPEAKVPPPPPAAPSAFTGFGGSSFASSSAPAPSSHPKSSFSMPAPAGGFSGFNFAPAASSTPPSEGGFKPQLASSPPANKPLSSFGEKPAEESSKPVEGGPSSNGVKSAFAFGSSSSTSSFAFGDSGKKTGENVFGSTPSVFSSAMFGVSATANSEQKDKPKDSTPSPSVFGGGLPTDKPSSGSSSPFAFGSGSPKPTFGFGKPSGSGSIGNPVGFGFGSPPRTPDAGAVPTSTASGFSFGAPKVTEANGDGDSEGQEATKHEAAEDAPPLLGTGSIHDQDGEGEEDEETKFEQKCKVFKMAKKDDGSQEWKDMGVGLLKVKAHKETDARRLLLRNSSTGKIQINFNVHAGMNPSVAKNVVSLMGHEEGVSLPYKLRVKTAEQAEELRRVLQEEAEKVKAQS